MQLFKNEQKKLSWDDVRIVLAVAKSGTLVQAAELLKCSHPTVFRRVKAIEQALGVKLFERSHSGYLATDAAVDLVKLAEQFDIDLGNIELKVAGRDEQPSGEVSLTTTDTFMHALLPAALARLPVALPAIRLSLNVSDTLMNLNRREADIALRSGGSPPDNLIGRKLCGIAVTLYRPAHWGEVSMSNLGQHPWVMHDESFSHLASYQWLAKQGLTAHASLRCSSTVTMASLANAGAGLAILPCYLGDIAPGLRRICPPMKAFESDLWLLSHPEMRRVKRIKAVQDYLMEAIKEQADLLEGRRPLLSQGEQRF
jgi:DNA-binding transcriptional LysR family regulator